jgi:short-subunit dehydrogenase
MDSSASVPKTLSGKVVVITGASMGIGEAIAKLFVEQGARVVLLSRNSGRIEAARARIGNLDQTLALACDVRNREEIDRVIGLTVHHFQRIDVWINNAGHGILDSVATVSMASARETFETNFFGTMEAMQAVLPIMKQQGSGTIINVSSVAGHIPIPFHGVYSATKFAMNALGKAARIELAASGINLLTVCPGYVQTEFGENAIKGVEAKRVRPKSARGITVERVARAVLRGYLKNKREVIVPWTMIPVVKLYQMLPGIVERAMQKMAQNAGNA